MSHLPNASAPRAAVSARGGATRVNVLGVGVSAVSMQQALDTIAGWVEGRETHYVCVSGVHGVMESHRDETLRRIHNAAGLVTPDGMPLAWLGRAFGGAHVQRVYGPDLMLACCSAFAGRGYRHFFYGGGAGVPERLASRLRERIPSLQVAGCYSPPFRAMTAEEDDALIRRINESGADIVWVGLSTPKQERWMHSHVGRLTAAALIGVGAAFDFHAGLKRQAPRWVQRSGMEWLFRLATEPRRLWRRYLRNNPEFVVRVLVQAAGLRTYDLSADIPSAVA